MKERFDASFAPEFLIAAVYILVGFVWIVFSDRLTFAEAASNSEILTALQTLKGVFFIFASGLLVFFLSRWAVGKERQMKNRIKDDSARLKHALQCGGHGMWEMYPVIDPTPRFSAEVFGMLGYDPPTDDAGAVDFFKSLVHPEDRNRVFSIFGKMLGKDASLRILFRVKNSKGQWRFILSCGRVNECDAAERATHIIGMHTDITESIVAEREKFETEQKFTRLINNLPGAAYRCLNKPDWPMQFISDGCLELTGYAPDELVGNSKIKYGDLILPEERGFVWGEIQSAMRNADKFEIEYRIRHADGSVRLVWERGYGIMNEQRTEVVALEGFIHDITDRRVHAKETQTTAMA